MASQQVCPICQGLAYHCGCLALRANIDAVKETPVKRRVGDGTPGPGRPKGSRNKTTVQLKDALLEAATAAGGEGGLVGYLTRQAEENPASFLTLLGKVLPLDVKGAGPGGSHVFQIVTGVPRAGD